MGLAANLINFKFGETVRVSVLAKERDGTVLANADTATMTFKLAALDTGVAIHTFTTTPEINLTDIPTADFTIVLPTATIPLILEGVSYRWDIWTTSVGGDVLHQAGGVLNLGSVAEL